MLKKVVMISGANRGIGKAIALKLYEEGFRISLGIRNLEKIDSDLQDLSKERAIIHFYDASEPKTEVTWVNSTLKKFGRIDALVNNAGIYYVLDIEDANEPLLDKLFEINTKAPIRLSRTVLPHLRQSGMGRIINIVSDAAKRVEDSKVGYSVSKFGFLAASHGMFHAAKKDGVRVTALCPAWVNTDMAKNETNLTPDQMIQPETIADVVLMLINLPNTAIITELFIDNM